ncbi:DUF3742 family protein [Shinella sumterensis]|uniref:DUF3742 family protein n=1 Tax=Rhizobiaceae TaxID=82115 RepID=UPI000BE275BE|nr:MULTISPECIES: DUF3742 family protein [Rhizobiaceae]MCW5711749.1 DUF3742 family protein [Shinella sp.]WLS08792.1 DUF3742 family protein [Shinella sumterensis]
MAAQSFTAEIVYILGRGARSVARGWAHCEHHVAGWLVANGVAPSAAQLLLDGVKFAALGTFFFAASWLAALVLFVIAVAWIVPLARWQDNEEPEWRMGWSGYGLYRGEDRIDPGDPYDDADF